MHPQTNTLVHKFARGFVPPGRDRNQRRITPGAQVSMVSSWLGACVCGGGGTEGEGHHAATWFSEKADEAHCDAGYQQHSYYT